MFRRLCYYSCHKGGDNISDGFNFDFDFDFENDFENDFDEMLRENIIENAKLFTPTPPENLIINQIQYAKCIVLMSLLEKLINPDFDIVRPLEINPSQRNCCIECDFQILNLNRLSNPDTVEIFEKAVGLCDAIYADVDTSKFSLHIEFLISNVYVEIEK